MTTHNVTVHAKVRKQNFSTYLVAGIFLHQVKTLQGFLLCCSGRTMCHPYRNEKTTGAEKAAQNGTKLNKIVQNLNVGAYRKVCTHLENNSRIGKQNQ